MSYRGGVESHLGNSDIRFKVLFHQKMARVYSSRGFSIALAQTEQKWPVLVNVRQLCSEP